MVREYRGRKQPLRDGSSSRGGLCSGRAPGAAGRQMVAVRPQRLAQPDLSRSRQVTSGALTRSCLPQKTRYALRMAHPLARIVEQLKREPSRTGSIAITVFGDAIVPRGGSVWLGTLLAFFKTLDIQSGVVGPALSRLAAGR